MTIGRYARRRDEPFFWWGSPHDRREIPTLRDLIERGTIDRESAALALVLIERGVSMVVLSETSGAGKSTLLHALISAASIEREKIYLRGGYETFDFLGSSRPGSAVLLVNEISAHLPAYLWGKPVLRLFEAMSQGFQMAGTAHGESPAAFLQAMISPPLDVPATLVMRPMMIITLPGAGLTAIQPGAHPGSAVLDALDGFVDQSGRLEWTRRLLAAAMIPADDLQLHFDERLASVA